MTVLAEYVGGATIGHFPMCAVNGKRERWKEWHAWRDSNTRPLVPEFWERPKKE